MPPPFDDEKQASCRPDRGVDRLRNTSCGDFGLSNYLRNRQVCVIGGGIAGLTAATALAQRGAQVTVLERAPAQTEVGAGLQISPNAGRVLDALGLAQAVDSVSVRSEGVVMHSAAGRQIAVLPLSTRQPGAAFRMIQRARLVEVLGDAARAAGADLQFGQQVAMPLQTDATLLVGADGLHSVVRPLLNGPETPFFTGQTAWRTLIPDPVEDPFARVFMGPGRHLVSYPLGGGLRNIVAVQERADWVAESWSHQDEPANLRAAFAHFGGPVPGWLSRVETCGIWGLFRHEIASRWHDDKHVILGDAAHPTLPFMAQGAVMAIEDAWILAACLDAIPDQGAALARYQALRLPRVRKVINAANGNARNYHLTGPARIVAHLGLGALSRIAPATLPSRFDWIYDYDPVAERVA